MNRSGFTLIELLLASAIGAIVTGLLFGALFQINKAATIVDDRMDVESKIARLRDQLQHDLSAATILALEKNEKKPDDDTQKKADDQKEAKELKVPKIFYSKQQGNNLGILTFITNNPRRQFWGEREVKLQPLLARVVYKLQEDPQLRGSFVLMRQESPELQFDAYNSEKIRSYRFMDGIKNLSFTFTAKIDEEKQAKKDSQQKQQVEKTSETIFKILNEWDVEDTEKEKKQTKKQQPIPVLVEVTGSMMSGRKGRIVPFNFAFAIRTDTEKKSVPPKPQTNNNAQAQQNIQQPTKVGYSVKPKTKVVIPTQSASFFFDPFGNKNQRKKA